MLSELVLTRKRAAVLNLFSTITLAFAVGQDVSSIYQNSRSAVVSIECQLSGGRGRSGGTGFFVSKDGIIITNFHVIQNAAMISVRDNSGRVWTDVSVGAYDEGSDLAALKVPAFSTPFLKVADWHNSKVGERVAAIGNPMGFESSVSDGLISGIRSIPVVKCQVLQTTVPVSHGSSGGPLLTMTGNVIGVTSFMFVNGQNLNFAVPLIEFFSQLDLHRFPKQPSPHPFQEQGEDLSSLTKAENAIKAGQPERAKPILLSLLKREPDNVKALLLSARVSMLEWNYKDAQRRLTKLLDAGVATCEVYCLMGEVAQKLGKPLDAITHFNRAASVDPGSATAHYALALLYYSKGDIVESDKHVARLKALDGGLYRKFLQTH
jgi:hypothetical protein